MSATGVDGKANIEGGRAKLMGDAELLVSYSEISVGFAGFASIVVVFRRRASGAWEVDDAFRFGAMLRASLLPAFFSLLPLPLLRLGIPDVQVWQFTSFLIATYMIWGGTRLARLRNALTSSRRAALVLFHVAVLSTQLVNLFGIGAAPNSGWVSLGLVGCLSLAGWHFYRLVLGSIGDSSGA